MNKIIAQCLATGALAPCFITAFSGCSTSTANLPSPQATVQAPPLPQPPPSVSTPPSTLSYGMVTGRVKKGVTTQQEIIDLFGGPSTMTTDKDGTEVWMYDKTTSTVSGSYAQSSSQASQSEASTMAAFLGIPFLAGVGAVKETGSSQLADVSQGANNVTRSVKTITFIIKFGEDKTVKDYAVRQSSY